MPFTNAIYNKWHYWQMTFLTNGTLNKWHKKWKKKLHFLKVKVYDKISQFFFDILNQIDKLMGSNNADPWGMARVLFLIAFPKIGKFLDMAFVNPEAMEFIVQIIRAQRYKTFLQL